MNSSSKNVTKEMIFNFLVEHPGSHVNRIQKSLHCNFYVADRLLEEMQMEGSVTTTPNKKYQNSYLFWPVQKESRFAAYRSQPEFKPLLIDMGQFMRLCQGARKSETGMA